MVSLSKLRATYAATTTSVDTSSAWPSVFVLQRLTCQNDLLCNVSRGLAQLETLHFVCASSQTAIDLQSISMIGSADDHAYGKIYANYLLLAPLLSARHLADQFEKFRKQQDNQLSQEDEVDNKPHF